MFREDGEIILKNIRLISIIVAALITFLAVNGIAQKFPAESSQDKKERELMKSLCLGIVGDTGQLLSDQGFNKPIDVLELIIFAMFVVTDTYTLSQKGLDKASRQLDQFHLDMVNHVTDKYFLKENTGKDTKGMFAFRDQFYDAIGNRYTEYRRLFTEDLNNPGTVYSKTVRALLNHLFAEPISEDDKARLIVPMALKLAEFYTGCLKLFSKRN